VLRPAQNSVLLWMASKSLVLIQTLVLKMASEALVPSQASKAVVLKLASVVAVLQQVLVQIVKLAAVLRMGVQAIKTAILRLYCKDLTKVL